jgi:hypothetical protein
MGHEWHRSRTTTWFSATTGRIRLVRHGVREVAAVHRGRRYAVRRLSIDRGLPLQCDARRAWHAGVADAGAFPAHPARYARFSLAHAPSDLRHVRDHWPRGRGDRVSPAWMSASTAGRPGLPRRSLPPKARTPGNHGVGHGRCRCLATTSCAVERGIQPVTSSLSSPSGPRCSGSALMLGAQQRECVLDALIEDVVGEPPVGQAAGDLQRPDHQGEDAERLHAR